MDKAIRRFCSPNTQIRQHGLCLARVKWPVSMRARASAAAAPAWATVSGISFGPWQQPARKIPSVKVLTGASLGCRSMKIAPSSM